jgi:class 3 adenylate cyclase
MDAAGSDRAALLGISEGGPMSILFAASCPERVTHLILYGTYARMTRADDYPVGTPREQVERWLDRMVQRWGGPAGIELFAPSGASDEEFAAWWGHLLRSGTSPHAALRLMRMYLDIDVRPALTALTAPTLILQRTGDRVAPVSWGRALAAMIPHCRYVELPGEDHAWFVGDHEQILDEIEEFVTGTRRVREPERVLATVLFTDIVDSTAKAAALGDRKWRSLLDAHDAAVRDQLHRFRGEEVKTTGDGFVATFSGPARAIRCARAITEVVHGLGIDVRAGLHTGECEVRTGDLGGVAVHIAARVVAAAASREVLVSSTVRDLVIGSGLEFDDRGEHDLKGVPGTWKLYALKGSG